MGVSGVGWPCGSSLSRSWRVSVSHGGGLASAAGEGLGLGWSAPEGCPDADAVRARVTRRLVGSADSTNAVQIVIERQGDALVAHIQAGDVSRTLTSASCDELADAGPLR